MDITSFRGATPSAMNGRDPGRQSRIPRPLLRIGLALMLLLPGVMPALAEQPAARLAADYNLTLGPGQCSSTQRWTVSIPTSPPKADVIFSFDTTGSMGTTLAAAKSQAGAIMTSLAANISDINFAVNAYRDEGDAYVYQLTQALTSNQSSVQTAINSLSTDGGGDTEEAAWAALEGSYSTQGIYAPGMGLRTGSRRFVILFTDAPSDYDGHYPDGNPRDDLTAILGQMRTNNITLLVVVTGGGVQSYWEEWAALSAPTGDAVPLGSDLATTVLDLISNATATIGSLTLQASSGYSAWLSSVSPASYSSVPAGESREFTYAICAPGGSTGSYSFSIEAVGDGATYGTRSYAVQTAYDTSTAVSSSLNPSTYGNSVTVHADVTSSGGTPTGNVNFLDDGDPIAGCSGLALSSGRASCALPVALAAGTHNITANYLGVTLYLPSSGTLDHQTVNKATPVVTTVIHDGSHGVISGPMPISTVVHGRAGVAGTATTPSGSASFTAYTDRSCSAGSTAAGTVSLSSGVADPSNNATLTRPNNALSFKATYNGEDPNYNTASSGCALLDAVTTTYADPAASGMYCGGNWPCYTSVQAAIEAVATGGTVFVAAGAYGEAVIARYNTTVWDQGNTSLTSLNIASGTTFHAPAGLLNIVGDLLNYGTYNHRNGAVVFGGTGSLRTGGAELCGVTVNSGTRTLADALAANCQVTIAAPATLDVSASSFGVTARAGWSQSGGLTPHSGTVTFDGATTMTGSDLTFFNNLTVNSGKSLTATSGNINVLGNWRNDGTFTHNSGTVTFNGTTAITGASTNSFQNLVIGSGKALTGPSGGNVNVAGNWTNGGAFTHNGGTVTFDGVTTVGGANATSFNHVAITGSLTGRSAGDKNFNVAGDWTRSGPFTANGGTVTFNGAGALSGATSFFQQISSAGTRTLNASATMSNNLTLSGGSYILVGSNTADHIVPDGDIFTLGSGALLTIGGGSHFPTHYQSYALAPNSTVEYCADGDQIIDPTPIYGNLTLCGSGVKSLAGTTTVKGILTIGGTAILSAGAHTLYQGGNWVNNSGFWAGTGTVIFDGDTSVLGSSINTFHDVTIAASADLTGAVSANMNVVGDWANEGGAYHHSSGTVTFTADGTVLSGGSPFCGLTNNGGIRLLEDHLYLNCDLVLNPGSKLDVTTSNFNVTVEGNWYNYGGIYDARGGLVTLIGNKTVLSGGWPFNHLTNSSGTRTLGDALIVNGRFIFSGTVDVSAGNFRITVGGDWVNNGAFVERSGEVVFNGRSAILGNVTSFHDLTINPSAIVAGHATNANVAGDWTNSGTYRNNGGTVTFNGAGAVNGATTFFHLASSAGERTLYASATMSGNLTISGGVFDLQSYTADHVLPPGHVLTVGGGATLRLGGTGDLPANYGSYVFSPTSTVEYCGSGAQSIAAQSYGNLTICGSGIKSLMGGTSAAGVLTIRDTATLADVTYDLSVGGNWVNSSVFSAGSGTVTFNGATTVSGSSANTFNKLAIAASSTLTGPVGGLLTVQGNWSNLGSFVHNNGLVTFSDSGSLLSGGSPFCGLTVSGGTRTLADALSVACDLTISGGAALDVSASNFGVSAAGNWSNGGAFNARAGTVTLSGNKVLTSGSSAFHDLTNSSGARTLADALVVNGNLTIGGGTLDVSAGSHAVTVTGDWANSGAFTARAGTVTFNGTGAFSGATSFYNLLSSSGVRTMNASATMSRNLTISGGSFILVGASTADHILPAGDTFTLGSGAVLSVGTGGHFPTNYSTYTLAGTSTVQYCAEGNQIIDAAPVYGNLRICGSGVKSLSGGTTAAGNLSIEDTATFSAGAYTFNLAGNWANNSAFSAGSGTVNFNGATIISGSSTNAFNHVIIAGASSLTAPTGGRFSVAGNWTNNGTFYHVNSTATFNGTGSVLSGGSPFCGVVVSAGVRTLSDPLVVRCDLTLDGGTLDVSPSNHDITVTGAWNNIGSLGTNFNRRSGTVFMDGSGAIRSHDMPFNHLTTITGTRVLSDAVIVNGRLTIGPAGTLDVGVAGSYDVTVGGDWTNDGGFQGRAGTVVFNNNTIVLGASTTTFHNVLIRPSQSLEGHAVNMNVEGDWTNNGAYFRGGGMVTFVGSGALNGATDFYDLTISAGTRTLNANATMYHNLTVSGGVLDLQSYTADHNFPPDADTFTVGDGAIVRTGAGSHLPTHYANRVFTTGSTIEYCALGDETIEALAYGNLTICGSGTKSLSGGTSVARVLTIRDTATLADVTYDLSVGGNWVNNSAFTAGTGTVTFNGASAILGGSTTTFRHVAISGGAVVTGAAGNFNVAGDWANAGTFAANGGAVTFTGGGAVLSGGSPFCDLVVSSGTRTLADAVAIDCNLTIAGGGVLDVSAGSYGVSIRGNWLQNGAFDARAGLVTFNGATTMSGSGSHHLYSVAIGTGKTLTGPGALYAGGDWANAGSYVAGSGTVILDGGDQSLSGSTTFHNLSKVVTSPSILTVGAGVTQTVLDTLTLTGNLGNLLTLRSSAPGARWTLDPRAGSWSVAYVDVQDSANLNITYIEPTNSVNSGNNRHWFPADVGITKTVSPLSAKPGDRITYTLTFSNAVGDAAESVVITDTLPVSVTSATVTSSGAAVVSIPGRRFAWTVVDLPAGDGGSLTVSGVLSSPLKAGEFANTVDIGTSTQEESAENNHAGVIFTVLNVPPVAASHAYTMLEDAVLTVPAVGLLAGAYDLNGDALTAGHGQDPATGALTIRASGAFTYTPPADAFGVITFTYVANDGVQDSTPAVVTVTVLPVNDAPSFTAGLSQITEAGAGAQTMAGWAKDISRGPDNESAQSLEFLLSSNNSALFAVLPAVGAANGDLTYTPSGVAGQSLITITLKDSGGTVNGGVDTTGAQLFTITVGHAKSLEISPTVGGGLTYTNTQGDPTVVEIPGPAVTETLEFLYTALAAPSQGNGASFTFAGRAFRLEAFRNGVLVPGYVFNAPVTITIHYSDADVAGVFSDASLTLRYWDGSSWSSGGIALVERDTANNRIVFTLAHLSEFSLWGAKLQRVYLPLITNNFLIAPDLVVQSIEASGANIRVVIKNQGNGPVLNEFWVDVYIAPTTAPTMVNQIWTQVGSQGLAWGVTADAFPSLLPGGTLTLNVGDKYFVGDRSHASWPLAAGTAIYAQVDSWNPGSAYGAVLESHEIRGQPYNNILGPILVAPGTSSAGNPAAGVLMINASKKLPARP